MKTFTAIVWVAYCLVVTMNFSYGQAEQPVPGPASDAPPAPGSSVYLPPGTMQAAPTQGKFALELANRLGMNTQSIAQNAVRSLQAIGIQPEAGWAIDKPATDFFVVQVQKSFVSLLYDVSQNTGTVPPPTLSLSVLTEPFAPQAIFYSPIEKEIITPDESTPVETAQSDDLRVGQLLGVNIHSPHPYPAGDENQPAVWRYTFSHPGASFLKLHLSQLALEGADHLIIRDSNGMEVQRFDGDIAETGVWVHAVDGDSLVLELYADNSGNAYGVAIDQFAYGQNTGTSTDQQETEQGASPEPEQD